MMRETPALLDAFEHLPADEKRRFTKELLRHFLPYDSGALDDEEIGAASSAHLHSFYEEDTHPSAG